MPELVYPTGSARVRFAADGSVDGFATLARPDLGYLTRAGEVGCWSDGRELTWGEPEIGADVDELEVTRDADVGIRATVRHTFDPTWTVRLRLLNPTDAPLWLDDVLLRWRTAPGFPAVALAAGAVAAYAVQPEAGRGPVLVGVLTSGDQPGVDEDGFRLGPFELAPGASRVVQWRWQLVGTARQAGRAAAWPATTWFDASQPVTLPAGPDVAVVADRLGVETDADTVELTAPGPGAYDVELRSARGTTRLALDWAPDLDTLVDEVAAQHLAGPRTRAGIPRLEGPVAGLVVQQALARQAVPDARAADEALELLAADLAETDALDPVALALLAQEAERTGDDALLVRAESGVLDLRRPEPGLGLAATRVCLSLVRSGRSVAAVTAHLAALVDAEPGSALELRLVTGPRTSGGSEPGQDSVDLLLRVGAELGAGLVGRRLPPVPLSTVAHRAAVLALVPEAAGNEFRAWWGISAAELARRTAAEARSRVGRELGSRTPTPDAYAALGWLVLGAPLA